MSTKLVLNAGTISADRPVVVAPKLEEPTRKISPVWVSDAPRTDGGNACVKCATRGSSH
jgi:hypothetical protein